MAAGRSGARPGRALVAALPYRYDEVGRGHHGYFNPSNIVELDGAHYMFAFATRAGLQREGNCLLRTTDLATPGSVARLGRRRVRGDVHRSLHQQADAAEARLRAGRAGSVAVAGDQPRAARPERLVHRTHARTAAAAAGSATRPAPTCCIGRRPRRCCPASAWALGIAATRRRSPTRRCSTRPARTATSRPSWAIGRCCSDPVRYRAMPDRNGPRLIRLPVAVTPVDAWRATQQGAIPC